MKDKYFLDTNIIVYTFNKENPDKQKKAANLLEKALTANRGIISYQVIQEFVNVALYKFKDPLKSNDCKLFIDSFLSPLCEVYASIELFKDAINIKTETGISYYDSIIAAAAIYGNCDILYSEDFNDGQKIRTVQVINPFK